MARELLNRGRILGHAASKGILLLVFAGVACSSVELSPEQAQHHEVRASELPPPFATRSSTNPPRIIARPESAKLTLPPGFQINPWAEEGMSNPRWMALAPNGDVFVSDSRSGRILVLRDSKNSGRADQQFVFATGLNQPFGLAFWRDYLYVGNTNAVVRFRYRTGQTKAEGATEKIVSLPVGGHWTRTIVFNPEGSKMFATVGSASNNDPPEHPMEAAISEFSPTGAGQRIVARGMRNPIGLAFHPVTQQLWTTVQERDGLGDDLVPDYLTSVRDRGFYGWPYAYIGGNPDPKNPGHKDLVSKTIVPDLLFQAHSSAFGLVFYEGDMFPPEYHGDAFVALHGSWNRSQRTGYKVVRVRFKDGRPVGGYDDFVIGWMLSPQSRDVWGRPAGLLVLKDGSLLIADDGANKIWRVTYKK